MRGAIVAAMVLAVVTSAQNPVAVSGVVLDTEGTPIEDAELSHSGIRGSTTYTDAQGRFDLRPEGIRWVVRKPGYESQSVATLGSQTNLRVVLHPQTRSLPPCEQVLTCRSLNGVFCFPAVEGVKAKTLHFDPNSAAQSFSVKRPRVKRSIIHGTGAPWSTFPYKALVGEAVQYQETAYPRMDRGVTLNIIDARGKEPQFGTHWRSLSFLGEYALYVGADQPTAALFDTVLDGVCLIPPKK